MNRRMQNLQLASPFPLELMATCEGGRHEERNIHRQLKHSGLHVRGEWFKLEGATLICIEKMSPASFFCRKTEQQQRAIERQASKEAAYPVTPIACAHDLDPISARRAQRRQWWAAAKQQ